MATASLSKVLSHLRGILARPDTEGQTDGELLERFLSRREESAFEGLLRRHGPMVLGVCRALLPNEADAEDGFQATFLIFAQKARSIRKTPSLGSWLHGVASRTARRAQTEFARRHKHERLAGRRPSQFSSVVDPEGEVHFINTLRL